MTSLHVTTSLCLSRTNYYLVMECAANGDLAGHLERSRRFGEAEAARFMVQTSQAIAFCHTRGVIHRDIKPENLLLDANYDIKVTDFGLSAIVKPGQLLKVACGTPSYSAPEVIARREYDGALTDVWSLGVLLYHMCHGSLPFNNTGQIRAAEYSVAQEAMAPGALDLMRRVLVVRPEKRLTLPQVLEHPWMVHWTRHAYVEPKLRYGVNHERSDDALLQHIEDKYGFKVEHTHASLKANLFNHATATYTLLEELRDP